VYCDVLGNDHLTLIPNDAEKNILILVEVCFVLNFFFGQHELEFFFLSRQARNFFPEFHIRLYDKNSESDYFFFASTKIRIFFSASLGIRVKWSFPNTSQYTTIHYGFFKSQYWYNTGKKNYTSIVHNTSIPVL
jgi:hypothetical protein